MKFVLNNYGKGEHSFQFKANVNKDNFDTCKYLAGRLCFGSFGGFAGFCKPS